MMNKRKAERLSKELYNRFVGKWKVGKLINSGKSAFVCNAFRNKEKRAIKIFDPDIIEQYGEKKQLQRINRQLKLIKKQHPNLVKIYDGGLCKNTNYYFIVMEYIDAQDLSQVLENIPSVMSTL